MKIRSNLKLIICLITLLMLYSLSLTAGSSDNPLDYLDLTIPAKYRALGQSYTAYCSGAESIWLNPAGLNNSPLELALSGMQGLEDISSINGSFLLPLKQVGNIGIGFSYLGSPDEAFENAAGYTVADTQLRFENYLINAGYGIEIYNIALGVSFKFVHAELALDKDILFLGSFGAQKSFDFLKLSDFLGNNFTIGLLVRDLGLKNYTDSEFASLRTGIDYHFLSWSIFDFNLMADMGNYGFKSNVELSTGVQIRFFKQVYLLAGYNTGNIDQITVGGGAVFAIGSSGFEADYASNPLSSLPMSHWIDFHYHSVKSGLDKKAEQHFTQAEKNYNSGNYNEAEKELGQAMTIINRKKNEAKIREYIDRADDLMAKNDRPNAIKELQTALTIDPYSTQVHTKIGWIYYNDGDNKQAYESVKNALKIDPNDEGAKELEHLIVKKAEKEKSVWLTEDKYYTEQKLTFEDFAEASDISKFIAQSGQFERVVEGQEKYGKWRVTLSSSEAVLATAIRLPDLTRFDGVMISLKSSTISRVDLVIIEQLSSRENRWRVPVSGLKSEWRHLKIPFRYFQCTSDPNAKLDLSRISAVHIAVSSDFPELKDMNNKTAVIAVDNLAFYKD